jgi:uracil-DNA glycosylase family 4
VRAETTTSKTSSPEIERAGPPRDCPLCPRLVAFRETWRAKEPTWQNAPVPAFGSLDAPVLIVGLAPGLQGANRTGRPFTGDYAGDLLYPTLIEYGFAKGIYEERPDDSVEMVDARISNAVRCVPPQNKPTTVEIRTCNDFLRAEIASMPNLRALITLGGIAHNAAIVALEGKRSAFKFTHACQHSVGGIALFNSYHCSRYNTNTGVLTTDMFRDVFAKARAFLG